MMSAKEALKNEILVEMKNVLNANDMTILEHVLVKKLSRVEVVEVETLPATVQDSNLYILDLFDVRKAPKISARSAEQYKRSIQNLIAYTGKQLTLINSMDVDDYINMYATRINIFGRKNSPTTVNNELRFISAFFAWMRKEHFILANPCDSVEQRKTVVKPIEHLTAQEMDKLRSACKTTRDRALLEFLRCTAMRKGEVPNVRISDIAWGNDIGVISIFGHKNQTYRTVCLDELAELWVREYIHEKGETEYSSAYLFTHVRDKERLEETGIYAAVKAIAARSGVKKNVYPHIFRKTTATNIVKRGGSDELAGEYLGHTPQGVTGRHYTYKGNDHVVEIFKKFVAAV